MPFLGYRKLNVLSTLGMPEQTNFKMWHNSKFPWRSICIQIIKKIQQTTKKLLIRYPGYSGHVQAHPTTPTKEDSINLQKTLIIICILGKKTSKNPAILRYFNFKVKFETAMVSCSRFVFITNTFGSATPVVRQQIWVLRIHLTYQTLWVSNYFVCRRFAVQNLLRSLEFVVQINLEHGTIAV